MIDYEEFKLKVEIEVRYSGRVYTIDALWESEQLLSEWTFLRRPNFIEKLFGITLQSKITLAKSKLVRKLYNTVKRHSIAEKVCSELSSNNKLNKKTGEKLPPPIRTPPPDGF